MAIWRIMALMEVEFILLLVPQPPVEQEEASSPWGEFLRRKKFGMKGQQHGQEV